MAYHQQGAPLKRPVVGNVPEELLVSELAPSADLASEFMTPAAIEASQPEPQSGGHGAALAKARHRMIETGQWNSAQLMGRRWPIGCVALEITQRCNLDCSACYLSEHSEAVRDIPLEELFRRIDVIFDHYGPNTNIQVTGGDPTLRRREELIAIVQRISQKNMRPTLMTNGIRAKRDLLVELADAGLVDVVFHVDMTQKRRGYDSERALNALRREYIDRARGLPLSVMFNTTVFDGNFAQIPEIVRFFVRNCDVVRLASFQPQAEIGRGACGQRDVTITAQSIEKQIEAGAECVVSLDSLQVGHSRCSRYGAILVVNGRAYDALDDKSLIALLLERMPLLTFDRRYPAKVVRTFIRGLLTNPLTEARVGGWLLRKAWCAKGNLWAARGRVNKLSFVVHNFMDACGLEKERIAACAFMAMTQHGPISMCLHNAKRDAFIFEPIPLLGANGRFWDPASGRETNRQEQRARTHLLDRRLVEQRTKPDLPNGR
jgi:7,8-dihydro-6-hydroxymethylpterin dimethyltransferase